MTDQWDTRTDYGENREDIRTDDRPVGHRTDDGENRGHQDR